MPDKHLIIRLIQKGTVPLLLIIIALRQLVLAHAVGLSPWHGGGFGMFASIDRDERRLLEVMGIDLQGNSIEIDPISLSDLFSESDLILIRTFPSKALLQQAAQKVLDYFDLDDYESGGISIYQETETLEQFVPLQKVTVRVWRLCHDRKTSRIWYKPLSPVVEASR